MAERIRAREAVSHETVIEQADALTADGDWVLADELLKPLKTDPRSEMALTMNRLAADEGIGVRRGVGGRGDADAGGEGVGAVGSDGRDGVAE